MLAGPNKGKNCSLSHCCAVCPIVLLSGRLALQRTEVCPIVLCAVCPIVLCAVCPIVLCAVCPIVLFSGHLPL